MIWPVTGWFPRGTPEQKGNNETLEYLLPRYIG